MSGRRRWYTIYHLSKNGIGRRIEKTKCILSVDAKSKSIVYVQRIDGRHRHRRISKVAECECVDAGC